MKTNILGMNLISPVVVAPGPWSRGREKLKELLELGAGAVFTETIAGEVCPDLNPRYDFSRENRGVENIRIYSGMDLEAWIDDLEYINENSRFGSGTKLIASVMGSTPSEAAYIARKIAKTGVDAIELGLACPMGEGTLIAAGDPERVYEYTKAVVEAVEVPVSVKLSALTGNLPMVAKACVKAGASGISAIDTIRGILNIDIESRTPGLPTYGGYSGAPIRPIGLAAVGGIAQTVGLPIVGIGGIECSDNAIEYIMAGASAAGIGSRILIEGPEAVSRIVHDTDSWLSEHDVESIEEIRGAALKHLKSFDEIRIEGKHCGVTGECNDSDCLECIKGCLDDAIEFEDKIKIDDSRCTGCGLCVSKCPKDRLKLTW